MATPLQNAVLAMHNTLKAAAGVEVVYTQGSATFIVTALPGSTLTDSTFADGSVRTDRSHDFVISMDELFVTPTAGDTIDWDSRKYQVSHPAGGKVFDEVGPYKQLYRIHTKEMNAS